MNFPFQENFPFTFGINKMWHVLKMSLHLDYVLSQQYSLAFTMGFLWNFYCFPMFFLRTFHALSMMCHGFLCILHGFSVELPCVVLQIHLILVQCLMILPSCIPCYTMICITFLMFFIPLTLTPGSLFYSLVTSLAKEVMFLVVLVLSVCLFCLSVNNITQKVMNGLGWNFMDGSWVVQVRTD